VGKNDNKKLYYYMHYIAKNVSIELAEIYISKSIFESEYLQGPIKKKIEEGANI
jgi:hypothetical protein